MLSALPVLEMRRPFRRDAGDEGDDVRARRRVRLHVVLVDAEECEALLVAGRRGHMLGADVEAELASLIDKRSTSRFRAASSTSAMALPWDGVIVVHRTCVSMTR